MGSKDIADILREVSECGAEAMKQGSSAYLSHIKACKSCRMPYLINNITPNDVEVYLVSKL